MPLPAPILDDRSFEQLRDELVRRIPVFAPEWTDHNTSDPGIALLELFAFLGESLLFRFNQIPESTYLAYLRLLDVPLRAATPARSIVTFQPAGAAVVPVDRGSALRSGDLGWETLDEVAALPATACAVAKRATGAPQDDEHAELASQTLQKLGIQNLALALFYAPQVLASDPLAADASLLELPEAVDGTLWVAVLAKQPPALNGQALSLGFAWDGDAGAMADRTACPGPGAGRPGPPVVWQISSGQSDPGGEPRYETLQLIGDTTRGLTRDGVVRLRLPASVENRLFASPADELLGTGSWPPELEDDKLRQQVCVWLRAFRPDGGRFGRLRWLGINAVDAEETRRALPELLGVGTGETRQVQRLVHAPVLPGSLTIEVEEEDGFVAWRRVDSFEGSGEGDRHFTVDPEAGQVRFGDGVRGLAPPVGRRIRTGGYRFGGGRSGNVAANAINKIDGVSVKPSNALPARGGEDAETIAEALERIPAELRRRDRAVTHGDFGELALQTPGADVGRAECLPLFHPKRPSAQSAGVVSVVVWPREDYRHANAPMPDRALLDSVCAYLDERRLVTTELYVLPPTYRPVAVSVGVHVKAGYGVDAVRRWVELVIRQYLAPLPPYGPNGGGWPLGRRVHGPELEAAALQVEGVEYLEGLEVAERLDDGSFATRTVVLAPYEVPELVGITVVAGHSPQAPGTGLEPQPPEHTPVPVPVIPHRC
jgi:predicted phage baseplate assembly protein